MLNQPERLMYQMYEKDLDHKMSTNFDYVGLTNRPDLVAKLMGLSHPALKVVLAAISQMQMRPFGSPKELMSILEVSFDWANLNMTDRGYRSRVVKELREINFMHKMAKNKYLVNLWYVNVFTKTQHEAIVAEVALMRYTIDQT